MKEMVGGCCVCSDESGSPENPLVYCDGDGCTVAVHQACYGIVTVPAGSWYCKRCESQERAARVRCCLCPSRDGALKRTDNGQWAHVVCALYIPEIRFGNVTTMEPIMLHSVPPDRYKQSCYVCEAAGREEKSRAGACMPCNKSTCKNFFHVTCAQAKGLLCEEQGHFADDNVKYCGYCSHHYQKILNSSEKVMSKDSKRFTLVASRKDYPTIKPIPAFRPVPSARSAGSPDSSPDKKSPASYSSGYSSFSSNKDHCKDSDSSRVRDRVDSRAAGGDKEFGSSSSGTKKQKKDSSRNTTTSTVPSATSSSTLSSNSHSASANVSKKESSSSSVLSSSSFKDKDKDTFGKEKEREKERQEREREKERAKELISSRPFDEKPAGGQFSLSSFINPNLANKNQSKKLQQQPTTAELSALSASSKASDSNHKEKPSNREKDHSIKSVSDKSSSKLSSISCSLSSSKKESDFSIRASSKAQDKCSDVKKSSKKAKSVTSTTQATTSSSSLKATAKTDKSAKADSSISRSKSKDTTSFTGISNKSAKENANRRSSDTSTETDDEPIIKKSKLSSSLSSTSSSSLADKSSPDSISSNRKAASKKKTSNKSTASGKLNQTSSGVITGNGKKSSSGGAAAGASAALSSAGLHSSSSSSTTIHSVKGSREKSVSSATVSTAAFNGRGDRGEGKKSSTAALAATATAAASSSTPQSASGSMSSGRKRKTSNSLKSTSSSTAASVSGSKGRTKARTCSLDDEDDDEDDRDEDGEDESRDDVSSNGTEPTLDDEIETAPAVVTSAKHARTGKKNNGYMLPMSSPSPSPSLIPITSRRTGTAAHSIDIERSFVLPNPPSSKLSAAKVVTKEPTEPPPSSLEALLERQWAQGAQFIMDQAQHYDIASLLSCLSQIRQDNERLEERLRQLTSRREHLLTVNARLALPLNGSFAGTLSQMSGLSSSQLAVTGSHSSSSLPPFLAPQPPSIHHLLNSSVLDPSSRRLSSAAGDPALAINGGRYPALGMDASTLNSIFPPSGERGGFNLNSSLRSTPSPSRSSPFTPSGRPVNPRDPLGLNVSPVTGNSSHRAPADKR